MSVTHFNPNPYYPLRVACGASALRFRGSYLTPETAPVTCAQCKRTAAFKATAPGVALSVPPPRPSVPHDADGLNESRARWAEQALAVFREGTGIPDPRALTGLLCALMHWADRHHAPGRDFAACLSEAERRYQDQTEARQRTENENSPRSGDRTAGKGSVGV